MGKSLFRDSLSIVGPHLAADLRARYPLQPSDHGDLRGPIARSTTDWCFGCAVHEYLDGDNVTTGTLYFYEYTNPSSCSEWGPNCVGAACHSDDLLLFYNSTTAQSCSITADEATTGAEWRSRALGMLDGIAPWTITVPDHADGVQITADTDLRWSPTVFNRTRAACAFWEPLSAS